MGKKEACRKSSPPDGEVSTALFKNTTSLLTKVYLLRNGHGSTCLQSQHRGSWGKGIGVHSCPDLHGKIMSKSEYCYKAMNFLKLKVFSILKRKTAKCKDTHTGICLTPLKTYIYRLFWKAYCYLSNDGWNLYNLELKTTRIMQFRKWNGLVWNTFLNYKVFGCFTI